MSNIVSNIICTEFENNVGRWQNKNEKMIAMKLTFRLNIKMGLDFILDIITLKIGESGVKEMFL